MPSTQESQSSSDTSVVTMQAIENQGQLYQQQPTYVLLQTTGEQDSGGQPQVFLAMQTGGVTGQDSQVSFDFSALFFSCMENLLKNVMYCILRMATIY